MTDKISLNELMVRVFPGGFLIIIIYLLFEDKLKIDFSKNLDFLYSFAFICISFIMGELLQSIGREMDKIVDVFFKFRRPSSIYMYANNPVIKNEKLRIDIIDNLNLTKEEKNKVDIDYNKIHPFKTTKKADLIAHTYYKKQSIKKHVRSTIANSMRGFLFLRVITVEFLLISILLFALGHFILGSISTLVFLIFLWRYRGYSRQLIYLTMVTQVSENE